MILGNCPTDGLDDTMLTAEKEYSIYFTEQQKKTTSLCVRNVPNDFLVDNLKKTGLFRYVYDVSLWDLIMMFDIIMSMMLDYGSIDAESHKWKVISV